MSELNEELLNDDVDDFPEIGEAEEDALLQDEDEDVLNLVEEELGESESDHKQATESEERKPSRQDKFATERKRVTAPEPAGSNDEKPNHRFTKQNNRGRGRGGRQQQGRYQQYNNHQGRQYYNANQPGRSKTVLINPRFQGVVHVNNNGKGARLAWDTQQQQHQQHQQYQMNPWMSSGPGNNMGPSPPVSSGHSMHPHPQMQGPPPMQFQSQMQQFQGPPQIQAIQGPPQHMQQAPPMQNMGFSGQQMQFMPPHQQGFMPQPLPPGVPQSPMQPPNTPAQSSYWDGQNQMTSVPQGPNQQVIPYMQNNFESQRPPVVMNRNQPPPQMQNYQYSNQFNHAPPMQQQQQQQHPQNFAPNQHYVQQNPNRQVYNSTHMRRPNQGMQNKKDMVSPKRKVPALNFVQNKKRFVHDRLGSVEQSQVKVTVKGDDRPSVVKEVTVTNVTTVKIEDDEQTRDLRLKIEEQKRKREQVLRWKELRRLENLKQVKTEKQQKQQVLQPVQQRFAGQGRGRGAHQQQHRMNQHHIGASGRVPVLQPIKQIDDSKQLKLGGGVQNSSQNVGRRVITAQAVVPGEQPDVDEKQLSNFLADRKVLVKDESLMPTRKVVIKNISTSTGDKKIIQICKNIGDVQKLHRDKNERHATITFKSVASAHAFFKKYQRHMLDLSMIEVLLTPESDEQE